VNKFINYQLPNYKYKYYSHIVAKLAIPLKKINNAIWYTKVITIQQYMPLKQVSLNKISQQKQIKRIY